MPSVLTARQEECLRLTRFKTDKEIALELGLAEATVKKHVVEACQRLGVNRRKAALALLEQADAAVQANVGFRDAPPIQSIAATTPLGFYRAPPKGVWPRTALIGFIAVLLVLFVQATTHVIFSVHGQVDRIDRAVTPATSAVGVVPSVRR